MTIENTTTAPKMSNSEKIKRKRNVLLDKESESLLVQQEREEFGKVLTEQFSQVDMTQLSTLPECQNDPGLHLDNDNSWQYWMSLMLQYQMCRSYTHYSQEEEKQQKQLEWQKEMRFQLMQKKRAIKREKRKNLKQQLKKEGKIVTGKRRRAADKRNLGNEEESNSTKIRKLEETEFTSSSSLQSDSQEAEYLRSDSESDDESDGEDSLDRYSEMIDSVMTPTFTSALASLRTPGTANLNFDSFPMDFGNIMLPSPFPLAGPSIFAI